MKDRAKAAVTALFIFVVGMVVGNAIAMRPEPEEQEEPEPIVLVIHDKDLYLEEFDI